jgi:hypothetical protein
MKENEMTKMPKLLATAAVIAASVAFAASGADAQPRMPHEIHGVGAYGYVPGAGSAEAGHRQLVPSGDIYYGRYVGTDPDANVRFELRRDAIRE